ncbi:MAG: ATP-binding protein [Atribacterota bacterium]|nr:ATP-binding protein [Atribacterota bacterium]
MDTEKLNNKENKSKLGQQFLLLSYPQTLQEKAFKYEKQNYIKYLLDYSPDFQVILDGEGKIIRVNQAFEKISGKKRGELLGSFIYEFIPEEIIKNLRGQIIKKKRIENIEINVSRPGREPLLCDFSGVVFISKEGETIIYLSGRDMTERRKLQQNLIEVNENLEKKIMKRTKELRKLQFQLIQSEKLSIIGELVTSVAHEVRNPLATISLIVQHLESKSADNYQIEKLKAIQRNISRIDKIVFGLLNFSHPSRFNFDYYNVNEILERLEPILKHFLPENIKIIKRYDSKLPQGWFDSACLEQVFLNLISNAIQAMKKGGELYITTSFDPIQKGITIKFKDTGVGIPEGNLKKVFNPFFTTFKEGIGLGLSICRNIIKDHKGTILVESKSGKGAIFNIFLPLEKRKEKKQVEDEI